MRLFSPVKRSAKKYKKNKWYKLRFLYAEYCEKLPIKNNVVLIESFQGSNVNGAPFYIIEELCQNSRYNHLEIYCSVAPSKIESVKLILSLHRLDRVKIVERGTVEYCKLLSTAKYLVSNVTFPPFFCKRDSQIYLNTWHGTPIKGLGRFVRNKPNSIGNVQRNLLMADYILCSSEYVLKHLAFDNMITRIFSGTYLLGGCPQNTSLLNKSVRERIRSQLELDDKKVVVYMPTWRDKTSKSRYDKQLMYFLHLFYEMDKRLHDDVVVFAKLHDLTSCNVPWFDFEKVKPFPSELEIYETLSVADVLITDYSSVMFDFLNADKEIMLYSFDQEEYNKGRSLYFDLTELPFFQTDNAEILCNKLNDIDLHKSVSYPKEKLKYCGFDNIDATKALCERVFFEKKSELIKEISGTKYHNGKPNVLIFAGSLAKNGITTALRGLLNNVDPSKANFYISFYQRATNKTKPFDLINSLPEDVAYMPIQGAQLMTRKEAIFRYLYFRLNLDFNFIENGLDKLFKREFSRLYPNIDFYTLVHFSGYERQVVRMFYSAKAKNKIIFSHSDPGKEHKTRKNVHVLTLRKAYSEYDSIAIVQKAMKESIKAFFPKVDENKFKLVHNVNDIDRIMKFSIEEITSLSYQYCSVPFEVLNSILEEKDAYRFVNVGRFSKEKGLERLIDAFNVHSMRHDNTYLILVGAGGTERDEIQTIVESRGDNRIVMIDTMENPYPIVKKSDAFILSSYYEGLPMAVMEALILGKPIISTDIPGVTEFINQGYGLVVENSMEGIIEGIDSIYERRNKKDFKAFNAVEFNNNALNEFYSLLEID